MSDTDKYFMYMCACVHAKSVQSCPTLCDLWTVAHRLLCPWDSPGKDTGVGFCALLQGNVPPRDQTWVCYIFPHWQAGSLPLAPSGKPHFVYKNTLNFHFKLTSNHYPHLWLRIPRQRMVK